MYHPIRFAEDLWLDLERSSKHPLERVFLRANTQRRVQLRPFILETEDGPMEMADLFFEDGTTARGIPFASFTFVE
jgi:hypothetical protein